MARCGSALTRWCKLPMTGSCHGPGGGFAMRAPGDQRGGGMSTSYSGLLVVLDIFFGHGLAFDI
jgi:hypothetical protein